MCWSHSPSSALGKVSLSVASFDSFFWKGLGSLFIKLLCFVAKFIGSFFLFISLMTSPDHFSNMFFRSTLKRPAFFYAFFFQAWHLYKSHSMSSAKHLNARLKHVKSPTGINERRCLPMFKTLNRDSAQIYQQRSRKNWGPHHRHDLNMAQSPRDLEASCITTGFLCSCLRWAKK